MPDDAEDSGEWSRGASVPDDLRANRPSVLGPP